MLLFLVLLLRLLRALTPELRGRLAGVKMWEEKIREKVTDIKEDITGREKKN